MKTLLGTTLVVLSLGCPTSAQQEAAGPRDAAAVRSREFVLDVGSHELREVIEKAATFLGRNVLTHPQDFAAPAGSFEIRITERVRVGADGCWELLGSLLYHKGFGIVALDADKGLYEVVSLSGPRRSELGNGARFVPFEEVGHYANQRATPILTVCPLTHVNAQYATNALRPFFAHTGSGAGALMLSNVGNETSIVLQGMGAQVHAAIQLLKLADVPAPEPETAVRVVRLEHASAEEVADAVHDIVIERSRQMNMAQGAAGVPPAPALEVFAHAALNAVILSGTPDRVVAALDLIAQLDAPAAAERPAPGDLLRRLEALEQRVRELENTRSKER